MSESKTARRVSVEEPCHHGELGYHEFTVPHICNLEGCSPTTTRPCPGGHTRVLNPADFVLLERQTEWKYDDVNRLAWIVHAVLGDKLDRPVTWGDALVILNRLAEVPDPDTPHLPAGWKADLPLGAI